MSVKARMTCNSITDFGNCKQVKLACVYSSDKSSPNYTFSQSSPQGGLEITITNPAAFNQFVVGKTYDIDLTEYAPPQVADVPQELASDCIAA